MKMIDRIILFVRNMPVFEKGLQVLDKKIMAPILLAISLRNLRINKTRTVLSVLGIVIGIFAICTLGMAGAVFTESIQEIIDKNGDMIMVSALSDDAENPPENFMAYLPMLSDRDVSKIDRAVRKVTDDYSLSPLRRTVHPLTVNQNTVVSGLYMFGIKDKLETIVGTKLIEGTLPRMDTDILVTSGFADTYYLRIGNHLKTTANDGTEIRMKITGIVEDSLLTILYSIVQSPNIILLPDELYGRICSEDSVHQYPFLMIRLDDASQRQAVIDAVKKDMNGKYRTMNDDRISVDDLMAFSADLQTVLSMTVILALVVSAISLIIAAVSITNIMIISVQERKPEIGLMRGIGTTRRQITLMFLFETGLIGFFGSLAGVILSVIAVSLPLLLFLHDISYLLLPSVWMYLPLGLGIGILVCLISGLYPAIKAALLNPVEAMM